MEETLKKWKTAILRYYEIGGEFYKKYKTEYLVSSILTILASLLIFPIPIFTRKLIDVIYRKGNYHEILQLVLLILLTLTLSKILSFIANLMFYKLNSKIILLLREKMLTRILKSKFDLFRRYSTGYLLSRITEDPGYLNTLFGQQVINLFQNSIIAIISLFGLAFISLKLFIFVTIVIPLLGVLTIYFSKKMRRIFPIFLERRANEISTLQESLNAFAFLKTALREIVGIRRYFSDALKTHRTNVSYGKFHFGNLSISTFVTQVTPILVFGLGGYWVLSNQMTLGTLIAFNMFLGYLFTAINELLNTNITLQVALSALERIHEILNYPEEKYVVASKPVNSVELVNVSFKYDDREVLKNINLSAKRGEKIGIAGVSGEGKTTLLKIMSGVLYDFSGDYIVNGEKLDVERIIGLRTKMAIVYQEAILLRGSVRYNLKILNPLASDSEMFDIMHKLQMHDFIQSLPHGYDTLIDMKNFNLSVGQKQRIAFARAYLKHPDLMLLDEITSNLDVESEEVLLSVLAELKNAIIIIVSHRPGPLSLCDKIYLIKDGISTEFSDIGDLKDRLG